MPCPASRRRSQHLGQKLIQKMKKKMTIFFQCDSQLDTTTHAALSVAHVTKYYIVQWFSIHALYLLYERFVAGSLKSTSSLYWFTIYSNVKVDTDMSSLANTNSCSLNPFSTKHVESVTKHTTQHQVIAMILLVDQLMHKRCVHLCNGGIHLYTVLLWLAS